MPRSTPLPSPGTVNPNSSFHAWNAHCNGQLATIITTLRAQGASYQTVSSRLAIDYGVRRPTGEPIAFMTIRRWIKDFLLDPPGMTR